MLKPIHSDQIYMQKKELVIYLDLLLFFLIFFML